VCKVFKVDKLFIFLFRHLGRAVIVAAVQCQAIVMGCGCRIYTNIHASRNSGHCAQTRTPCTLLRLTSPHRCLSCALLLSLPPFDLKPLSSVVDTRPTRAMPACKHHALSLFLVWCLGWHCNRLPPQSSSSPHSHCLQQISPPLSIQLVYLSPGDKGQ
jgi:hypothetical protein